MTSAPLDPQKLTNEIKSFFKGEISFEEQTVKLYSHDTSMFEIKPTLVVFPTSILDLEKLVSFVSKNKKKYKNLSLTARSGGSDMSGGSINDSIIIDFSKHLNKVGDIKQNGTQVQSGTFYRDFEKKTLKHHLIFPSYPASKNLAALGGIIGNNSGGEKSLKYGKTIDYVTQLKMVLSNGQTYTFKRLDKNSLKQKLSQTDFEGTIYRKIYRLINTNYDLIQKAKPKVSKNSTGYNLWDVWDKKYFDLTKLFVGSQGTLGLNTDIKLRLVPTKKHQGLLAIYLNDIDKIPELINTVLAAKPDTFEAFDDHTLKLALQFMPQFIALLGLKETINMGLQFLPNLAMFATKGLPKFTFLVEFEADTQNEINQKIDDLDQHIAHLNLTTSPAKLPQQAERFKVIRRESFNLLRKNVKNKHSAAFIDDFIIKPQLLTEFFPKLIKILDKYDFLYTVAGHMGNGNFHIIPLMDLSLESERQKIEPATREVNTLVLDYKGSISAEHNEGLIRGPFIRQMYGRKMYQIFKQVKHIFDPQNIFNPHKKTDATMKYSMSHIRHSY